MSMTYAEKYSPFVDEAFALGSLTDALFGNAYDFIGVETVKVFSYPTATMNDYKTTGTDRYGTPEDLANEVQEMKLSKDRAFTVIVDKKDNTDTEFTADGAIVLARQVRDVIIPEVDTYRINSLVSAAQEANIITGTVSKDNAYELFLTAQAAVSDAKTPIGGRVAIITPAFYSYIKLDPSFTKYGDKATDIALNGQVGWIDSVPIIVAPKTYFPDGVSVVITHPEAGVSPIKLAEYKVHDDAPGISGWLVEGRVRYDAFVLNKKVGAIGVVKASA